MPASRRIWAWVVLMLGALWLLGGVMGWAQGHSEAALLALLGLILVNRALGMLKQ